MYFQYGNYKHDVNSVRFKGIQRSYVFGTTGRPNYLQVNWQLEGKLIRTSMSAIMSALTDLQNAYSINYQSAALFDNNNTLINPLWMDTNQALGGLIVTNPISHDGIKGADGVTYLYYTFGLQGNFSAGLNLLSYQESISFNDIYGGPLQAERQPAQGYPILQNVTERSWYHATQTGSLTINQAGPIPALPIWPANLRGNASAKRITYTPIKTIRGSIIETGVSWGYEFISVTPLVAFPHYNG